MTVLPPRTRGQVAGLPREPQSYGGARPSTHPPGSANGALPVESLLCMGSVARLAGLIDRPAALAAAVLLTTHFFQRGFPKMTIEYNGAGHGVSRRQTPDYVSLLDIAASQVPPWTSDELDHVLKLRKLQPVVLDGERKVASWHLQAKLPAAVAAIIDYRMTKNRPVQGPRSLGSGYKDLHFAAAHTGLSEAGVIDAAQQADAIAIDPATGEKKVDWGRFDRAWRNREFRSAVTRADKNRVAQQSADRVQAAAKEQTDDQILADARAVEDARCAAALENARAQQRAAAQQRYGHA